MVASKIKRASVSPSPESKFFPDCWRESNATDPYASIPNNGRGKPDKLLKINHESTFKTCKKTAI